MKTKLSTYIFHLQHLKDYFGDLDVCVVKVIDGVITIEPAPDPHASYPMGDRSQEPIVRIT